MFLSEFSISCYTWRKIKRFNQGELSLRYIYKGEKNMIERGKSRPSSCGGARGILFTAFLALLVVGFMAASVNAADPLGRIRDQEITQSLRLKAG